MSRLAAFGAVLALVTYAIPALAHPAPFTYVDLRIQPSSVELSLIAHAFDVAHDVALEQPERLMEEATLRERGPRFAELLAQRLQIMVDGTAVSLEPWTVVEALPERQSIRLTSRAATTSPPGVVRLSAHLFPYDTAHQTFVNFYDHDTIGSQSILDLSRREATYYAGTVSGGWAAVRLALPQAFTHIVTGLDHLAILGGLLLLGSTRRHALTMAMAFTAGHLLTASLAAFNVVSPPDRLIDPALALSVVYIGADNLISAGGRDVRSWMALVVGGIHGFGFAALLRFLGLSRPALAWSIGAVNLGVLVASALLATLFATAVTAVARHWPGRARMFAIGGSIAIMALGVAWFVQRVFFPGVLSFPI